MILASPALLACFFSASLRFTASSFLESLPDELLLLIQKAVSPSELGLISVSRRMRQSLLLFHAELPLNAEFSRRFVDEKGFRELARASRGNQWKKLVRLNLGPDFRDYLICSAFYAHVHALVETPVWSSVRVLDLSGTRIADIRALAGLRKLEKLHLGCSLVEDLDPLAGLRTLEYLNLNRTGVHSLRALAELKRLQWLCLTDTPVEDISPLETLTNLEYLNLHLTQVQDISSLAGLQKLNTLDLTNTPVDNLAALARIRSLRLLFIYRTLVVDVSVLAGLANLRICM